MMSRKGGGEHTSLGPLRLMVVVQLRPQRTRNTQLTRTGAYKFVALIVLQHWPWLRTLGITKRSVCHQQLAVCTHIHNISWRTGCKTKCGRMACFDF